MTGTTPFDEQTLKRAGFDEMRRMIREEEPVKPSAQVSTLKEARLSTISKQRKTEPARLRRILSGELDWIVIRAMEKDRHDRYGSVGELAEDIGRHLHSEPICARRPSLATRASKWSSRHRTLVWAAAAVLLVSVVALSASTMLIGGALAQTQTALGQVKIERDSAKKARDAAQQERDAAIRNLYVAQIRLAQRDWEDGQIARLEQALLSYLPLAGRTDLRGWEWYYLLSRSRDDMQSWRCARDGSVHVAWGPDGDHLATANYNGLKVWNAQSGELVTSELNQGFGSGLSWSPKGDRLAATGSGNDHRIKIWDFTRRRVHAVLPVDAWLEDIAWSPDGERLASAGPDNSVIIWTAENGEEVRKLVGHDTEVMRVAWSPNGKWLAASGDGPGIVLVWDIQTGKMCRTYASEDFILALTWSPDSSRVAVGTLNAGKLIVWDAANGKEVLAQSEGGPVRSIAWSPDGAQIATAIAGHVVTLRNATNGEVVRKFRSPTGPITSIAWRPDAKQIAAGDATGSVRIWQAREEQGTRTIAEDAEPSGHVAFSPNDRQLAYVAAHQQVKIRDVTSGRLIHSVPAPAGYRLKPVWSPSGDYLACAGDDGPILVYDTASGELVHRWLHEGVEAPVTTDAWRWVMVAWHPDGQRLASVSTKDPIVRIWNVATASEVGSFHTGRRLEPGQQPPVYQQAVAWSPDGKRLAIGSYYGPIEIWDRAGWRRLHVMQAENHESVWNFAWSPNGRYLASGAMSRTPTAKIWDTITGREVQSFEAHTGDVGVVGWSQDGRRIVSSGQDGVRIWNPQTGQELLSLPGAKGASWSHDRKTIAAVTDGKVRIYDASIGYRVATQPSYMNRHCDLLAKECFARVEDLLEQKKYAEAAQLADEQLPKFRDDLSHQAQARLLCYLEQCIRLAEQDESLPEPDRSVAVETYRARADELLHSWQQRAADDEDFAKRVAQTCFSHADGHFHKNEFDRALPLLEQAIRFDANHSEALDDRGQVYASLEQWDKSAADLARSIELSADLYHHWYLLALVQLASGDDDAYRETCSRMLQQFVETDDPDAAHFVAWSCALAPGPLDDLFGAIALGKKAVQSDPNNSRYLGSLGAVLYRAGRPEQAISKLEKANLLLDDPSASDSSSPAYCWYFLAMAHHELGNSEAAQEWLDKAVAWTDETLKIKPEGSGGSWNRRLTLQRLRDEAVEHLNRGEGHQEETENAKAE